MPLADFPVTAGHSLFHYLYTGQYDPPLLTGLPDVENAVRELKTKFQTYGLARTLELEALEILARDDIEGFSEKLDMFAIMDAVKGGYPIPIRKDPWFHGWIKGRIKTAFAQAKKLVQLTQPQSPEDDMGVAKIILGCMLETFADTMEALANPKSETVESVVVNGITGFEMVSSVSLHADGVDEDQETTTTEPFEVLDTPSESPSLSPAPASDHEHHLEWETCGTQQTPPAQELDPVLEPEVILGWGQSELRGEAWYHRYLARRNKASTPIVATNEAQSQPRRLR